MPDNLSMDSSVPTSCNPLWEDIVDVDDTSDLDENIQVPLSPNNDNDCIVHGSSQPLEMCESGYTTILESMNSLGPTALSYEHPIETQLPLRLPPTNPRIYSDDEWEYQRETFEKLYIHEDKPLKVVVKIMRDEFGFHAT